MRRTRKTGRNGQAPPVQRPVRDELAPESETSRDAVRRVRWETFVRAALRYVAFADFSESPRPMGTTQEEYQARTRREFAVFNRVEADLREAGQAVFRTCAKGYKQAVLEEVVHELSEETWNV